MASDLSRLAVLKRAKPGEVKATKPVYAFKPSKRIQAKIDIQYAPGFGPDALKWLEQWAKKHGAATMISSLPSEPLAYYTERQWSFVGVSYDIPPSWKGPQARTSLALEPFTLSFKSPRVVLPLKWPWSSTPMSVRVDAFSLKPQKQAVYTSLAERGWEVAGMFGYPYLGPSPKDPLTVKLPKLNAKVLPSRIRRVFRPWIKPDAQLHLRTMVAPSLEGALDTSKWPEDWSVPAPPPGERLEADTTPAAPAPKPQAPASKKNATPAPAPAKPSKSPPASKTSSCAHSPGEPPSPWFVLGACVVMAGAMRRRRS